jgi:hypothetical protein
MEGRSLMVAEEIELISSSFSIVLIVVSLIVLIQLASRSRSIRSFQVQLLVFTLVLIIAEIPRILGKLAVVEIGLVEEPGLALHTISMALFALFIGYRTMKFLR